MMTQGGSTTPRRSSMRLLVLGVGLGAALTLTASWASGANAPLITAKVAPGQPVGGLMNQGFVQTLTCSQKCDVTTVVSISRSDAEKLGFKGSGARVTVASSYTRLKPNARTNVPFVASAEGKKLLPKAKPGLAVMGQITAIQTANRKVIVKKTWQTVLK